ncbi:aspartate aminotransferase family protein [Halothermothrix orenii]|uniref:Acetylornithine aminotransferase n=1 Tax=Halothermothrix orenii (strain H 168 / OCM 544 / DSM 9562) TaxID=373903 RepID=B8D1G9_HALOH|nr:aspartate aminotransferase family protein [Halothermothrix orenii]ACL69046.1 acetylornithine and succinylornithine aminotransferase [Halothermothrix orenii H 168]
MLRDEIITCDKNYFMNVFKGRFPLVVDHGEGVKVYDKNGKVYCDFLSGIGVNALGYSCPELVEALREQVEKIIHCSNLYYIEPQAELEKWLVNHSVADRVFFSNSGAEANEGAIKLARKYFEVRNENKYEIITAQNSFHGRTLMTLAATGQEKYHRFFQPLPQGFKYVPFNDLEAVYRSVGPNTAAIMVEPIQGEGGVYPATREYLEGLRKLCDEENILLIFDEIQCGIGKTGTLFAYEYYGVEPDIFTLAKALGGGVPIGAFLAREEVANAFKPGDHGSTFGGNPLATRAAITTLKVIKERGLLNKVKKTGQYFKNLLEELKEEIDIVNEVRGVGLMLAIELNRNKARDIVNYMFEKGFLLNAVKDNIIRFLPPLIIEKTDIKNMVGELKTVLEKNNL